MIKGRMGRLCVAVAGFLAIAACGKVSELAGSGDVTDLDYCTLVMAHKVPRELGIDLQRRVAIARMNPDFHTAVLYAKSASDAEEKGAGFGAKVKEILTEDERKKLKEYFDSGKLVHVRIQNPPKEAIDNRPDNAPGKVQVAYTITYTPYQEEHPENWMKVEKKPDGSISREYHFGTHSWEELAEDEILSVNDAIEMLGMSDEECKRVAAGWLQKAKVEPTSRAAVLKTLEPKVGEKEHRDFYDAYCHWADASAAPVIAANFDRDRNQSIQTLVQVDYATAEKAVHSRWEKDGFWLNGSLKELAGKEGPWQEGVKKLQAQQPQWDAELKEEKRVGDLDKILSQVAAGGPDQGRAISSLTRWKVTPADAPRIRSAMLGLLKIQDSRVRRDVVHIFAGVATPADMSLLVEASKADKQYRDAKAEAIAGIFRLDPQKGREAFVAADDYEQVARAMENPPVPEAGVYPLLQDNNPKVVGGAIYLLRRIGDESAIAPLEAARSRVKDGRSIDEAIKSIRERAAKKAVK